MRVKKWKCCEGNWSADKKDSGDWRWCISRRSNRSVKAKTMTEKGSCRTNGWDFPTITRVDGREEGEFDKEEREGNHSLDKEEIRGPLPTRPSMWLTPVSIHQITCISQLIDHQPSRCCQHQRIPEG